MLLPKLDACLNSSSVFIIKQLNALVAFHGQPSPIHRVQ